MHLSGLIYSGLIIIQMIAVNMLFNDYTRDYVNKMEEKRLQIAVNYATDAAAYKMRISSDHLGQDYQDMTEFYVDPKVAVDTFATILGKNYGVPMNNETIQSILTDYVPVFMVVTYDGYYIMDKVRVNEGGEYNMVFTPKLPYSQLETEADGTTSIYSYRLVSNSAIKISSNGGIFRVNNPPLSKDEQNVFINNKISDVLNEYLLKNSFGNARGMIFIPPQMTTIRSTNPIKDTSVITYIDNFDLSGFGRNLQSFGIGGSKIEQNRVVAGFELEENGIMKKYYTYSDIIPAGADILETFDTKEEAAQNGYYFYIDR